MYFYKIKLFYNNYSVVILHTSTFKYLLYALYRIITCEIIPTIDLTSHNVSRVFESALTRSVIIVIFRAYLSPYVDVDRRSSFRGCTQLPGIRIRQRVGVDGWTSIRRRSKRGGQHHHRWSGRYMKPARRIGARFHRNLRTCRLLPSTMTPSFPFFLLAASCVCILYVLSLSFFQQMNFSHFASRNLKDHK